MNDFKSDLHLDPTHVWELEAAKKQYNDDERRSIAKRDLYRHLTGSIAGYEDVSVYESEAFKQTVRHLRETAEELHQIMGEGKAD